MTVWRKLNTPANGVVIYNFNHKGPHKLQLQLGETVQIHEENGGWYRGFSLRNKDALGIFPISYVKIKENKIENERDKEEENSIVEEVTSVLREWGYMWQGIYLKREDQLFTTVRELMMDLMEWRRQILSETLPGDQLKQLKQKVTSTVDYGNRIIGLDLVVRDDDGNVIDPDSTGVIELYRRHLSTSEKITQSVGLPGNEETKRRRETSISSTYSVYVNIKNVVCNINDDAQVFISLYDGVEGRFISEQYLVEWDKAGMPKDIDKLYNLTVLFTDLGIKDLKRDKMYLVCKIVRCGRMDLKEQDSKRLSHNIRRTFGIAVLYISDFLAGNVQYEDEKEHFLHLIPMPDQSFDAFVKKIISSPMPDVRGSGQGIWVSIKLLEGDAQQIQEEHPLLMNRHTAIARKQGFAEVIMPGEYRNDLYITIFNGEFERGHKSANKNIEVTMNVLSDDGNILENVISYGAGEQLISEYRSVIFYHNAKPEWNEPVKVVVPIEQFYTSHLRFTFKHRSSIEDKDKSQKIFAFAFLRLMNRDGTTLSDGCHELMVYKCDLKKVESSTYLKLASLKLEQTLMTPPAKGMAGSVAYATDKFSIKCLLCSTKLTQNLDLLGLLKWRVMPGKLKDILVTVMKVSGEEIVKFLTDTFDALFAILTENAKKYDKLVFDALVFTINLLADKKYHHFRPVLDAYIETRFGAIKVYGTLINVLKEYIECAGKKQGSDRNKLDQVLKAMKGMEYIFKFIVHSRLLYERAVSGKGKNEFQDDMRSLFQALVQLMENTKNETLLIQGAALKYFPASFADLLRVFDAKELGYYAREFIEKIPEKRLTSQKMDCIQNMIKSPLFENEDSRCVILPMVVSQLSKEMEKSEEIKICIDILSNILVTLMRRDVGLTHEDVLFLVTSLLRVVVKVVIRHQPVVGNYVACLTAMLQLMDEEHYRKYVNNFMSKEELRDFLVELFLLFGEFVSNNVYPRDWMVMTMVQNGVILNAIQHFSEALLTMFLRGDDFEVQLWNNFFHLSVAFITQESLQLENFSSAKKDKILEKYSDMRMIIGLKINSMWHHLGAHKTKFIPGLVGPFLEMTLLPQKDLRKATIPIFFDMIEVEYRTSGGFVNVETEMFRKLDVLVEGGKGDEEYKELFQKTLGDLFVSHPQLSSQGQLFVEGVTKLMERLLDYRTVVQGDDNIDNRMSCTVNVLNFYKNIRREEMFIRYVYKLCDLHLSVDNFTEAAYTLRLHADLLEWSDEQVFSGQGKYIAETQRQLKELLYKDIILYFDKGKSWEEAISMCKELAKQYEEQTFEYIKLSELLKQQAKFYDNIITQVRGEPEYFRVAFYGKGFPTFLKDKVFVYRGKEYQRLSDFGVKLQSQYPSAENLKYLSAPKDDVRNSNGQFLQINKVDPVPVARRKFIGKNVMEQITKFYDVNHVNTFQYSRKFHQGQKEKDNEFKTMWLERTVLYTSYKFPGILCWFEVTNSDMELISPIQYALETMISVNKELRSVIGQQKADVKLNINPLSMKLQGIVEAAVQGGTANYEKAFLIPQYLQQNPDHQGYVEQLKELLVEQIDILEEGIQLHSTRVSDNLRPLHDLIEKKYKDLKQHAEQWRNKTKVYVPVKRSARPLTIQRKSDENRTSFDNSFNGIPESPPPPIPIKNTPTVAAVDTPPPKPPRPYSKKLEEKPPLLPTKSTRKTSEQRSSGGSRSSGETEPPEINQSPALPPRRPTQKVRNNDQTPVEQAPSIAPRVPSPPTAVDSPPVPPKGKRGESTKM
ncbi:dedicator of cytokinesis protein 1-like [Actinia tenebrosa]|uniref:Dedicator of cytokinesis protein 1-like n=1 Tax=Actinia tenebrosa TaxID=6105 RepID=A0A6P8H1P1_ACTTE|nr:dedicator of cytokinesis protein 1-like [Actinia tenebrosa]